jgi:amino acid transporter
LKAEAMLRALNLRGAVAVNIITMIGIGPLITIPLVLAQLGGPLALIGWIAGAVVALCDGLVWAELGSRYPGSGGTYVFLREVFGRKRAGRMFAFLFNWQFLLYAPFLLATGYIGFANYAAYLVPAIAANWAHAAVAVAVGLLTILLLYRRTSALANTSIWLCGAAVLTLVLVIAASIPHIDLHRAFHLDGPVTFGWSFIAGFGGALYITLYDYVGYADAALVGDEVRDPVRTIPRAIVISIVIVAALYIALQIAVLGTIDWHTLVGVNGNPAPASAQFVGSTVVANSWGPWAARVVTLLVLITAFASVFGNLLGFSRIPYAAARDGEFFPIFARLHASGQFPYVSLLVIGAISLVACFLPLDIVIGILTAGIVLIQGVAQIVALAMLRARRERAPFRMWLFPLPAIVALGGWLLAFYSTGPIPMLLGAGWLVVGAVVYLIVARLQRAWPFAAVLALLALLVSGRADAFDRPWSTWHTSAVVQDHGYPVFTVDGKPFFVFGAAFFYERVPRDQWAESLRAYKRMGINTLDLYLIWNWHEVAPAEFDFTGRTSPRRDLHEVLRLAHQLGFKLIVRPGPVIRNEWRNGGYPAWLLERTEYNMPLHDVLEGRYPATATLQNKQADAAANEWLHNPTHLRYSARWLRTALHEIEPWSADVIAIALDDDQGAYLDNDTWPAPHWHAYIQWLRGTVQGAVGQRVPLFINTYQMKVPASAPVWAWGNWYQSDAYTIGEHDRAQLDFSTALLQTQPHLPVMVSEFQAGWLQAAGEGQARPADPTNTALALNEMLGLGVHGIVNFPVQDTIYPSGWEAPWANWSYAWDAALGLGQVWDDAGISALQTHARYGPTASFGAIVAAYGELLARTHVAADAAIIWPPSLFNERSLANGDVAILATAMIREQRSCRLRGLVCDAIDLRFADDATMGRYPALILPIRSAPSGAPLIPRAQSLLRRFATRTVTTADLVQPSIVQSGDAGARLLVANDNSFGLLTYANWSDARQTRIVTVRFQQRSVDLPIDVKPRDAMIVPIFTPARELRRMPNIGGEPRRGSFDFAGKSWLFSRYAGSQFVTDDVFGDGAPLQFIQNDNIRIGISPAAGARVFDLQRVPTTIDGDGGPDLISSPVSSIGLLRDDVLYPPSSSKRDYIAAYTHDFPAGTFNRTYRCQRPNDATFTAIVCTYEAPDLPVGGARFVRTIALASGASLADVTDDMWLNRRDDAQRLVSVSGFARNDKDVVLGDPAAGSFGVFDPRSQHTTVVVWGPADVDAATVTQKPGAAILRIVFAHATGHLRMGVVPAANLAEAQRALQANRP